MRLACRVALVGPQAFVGDDQGVCAFPAETIMALPFCGLILIVLSDNYY